MRERQQLESLKPADVNEIVLATSGASLPHAPRKCCVSGGVEKTWHQGCVKHLPLAHWLADGDVMEGMSSNILVVQGGAVYTARDGVLLGTVRNVILRVCRDNGIPVVEEPPKLDNVGEWEGCIVSSTSRLSMPVAEVQVVDPAADGEASVQHLPTDGLVARIDQLVLDAIEAASEPLYM